MSGQPVPWEKKPGEVGGDFNPEKTIGKVSRVMTVHPSWKSLVEREISKDVEIRGSGLELVTMTEAQRKEMRFGLLKRIRSIFSEWYNRPMPKSLEFSVPGEQRSENEAAVAYFRKAIKTGINTHAVPVQIYEW